MERPPHRRRPSLSVRAGAAQLPNLVQQARKQGAEVILIEYGGHADASSLHALQLADLVVIPCRPSAADLDAIEETIALAQRAKQGKQRWSSMLHRCVGI